MTCAPSEESDQPGHPPSRIKVFAVCLKKARILSYPLSAQRRLWSDWADGFVTMRLKWWLDQHRFSSILSQSRTQNYDCLRVSVHWSWWSSGHHWVVWRNHSLHQMSEPRHQKACFCHMRTTKAQISLRIHAVCSAPLLFAAWIVWHLNFLSPKFQDSS